MTKPKFTPKPNATDALREELVQALNLGSHGVDRAQALATVLVAHQTYIGNLIAFYTAQTALNEGEVMTPVGRKEAELLATAIRVELGIELS